MSRVPKRASRGLSRVASNLSASYRRRQLIARLARRGDHEAAIEKALNGAVRYSRAEPVIEGPLIILGFTNRSGSNLMAEYMRSCCGVVGLREALNHDTVLAQCKRLECQSFPEYMQSLNRRLQARAAKRNLDEVGPIGIKASADQLQMLYRWNIPAMFSGGVKLVTISRADRIAQAVSFSIARQTESWTSRQAQASGRVASAPVYLPNEISGFIHWVDQKNALMDLLISSFSIDVFSTSYENLTADPEGVLHATARFLGRPNSTWTAPERPRLAKQATSVNEVFADRFRAEILKTDSL